MVVSFCALERILRRTGDWIGVSATPAAYEVGDAPVFVALIVVYVSGKDDDARAQLFLLFLKVESELLFRRASAVTATVRFLVTGTGVRRVVYLSRVQIGLCVLREGEASVKCKLRI